jgi:hypothetical protein
MCNPLPSPMSNAKQSPEEANGDAKRYFRIFSKLPDFYLASLRFWKSPVSANKIDFV